MSDKETALEKIKKLLAKTQNNPSEHEVQSALLMAQRMQIKYNISMSEVEMVTNAKKTKNITKEELTDLEKSIWWVSLLGSVIARNFRCECVQESRYKKRILKFLGLQEDVPVAREVFLFSRASLEYCSDSYIANICNGINLTPMKKRPVHQQKVFTASDFVDDKNDYIKGFLKGLDAKFKEQVEKNNWGLMLVKDDAVIEYTKKNYSSHVSIPYSNKGKGNAEHYNAGYEDGYSIDYNKKLLDN